jgi:DNA polymerase I-like protein with 3'-5' exonuclease and polymerase domains
MTINFSEIMTVDIESYDPNLDKLGPGVYRKDGNVLGVAVSKSGVIREYLDLGHPNLPESRKLYNLRRLRDLMADPCPKLGANFGYDLDWIVNDLGMPVKGVKHDIQIAEPLLNAYRRSYSLDALSVDYLGEHKKDDEILLWCRKHGLIKENDDKTPPQKFLYLMPFELASRYALSDIDQTARIFEKQWPQIVEQELVQVYEMESELLDIFCMMRKNGIRIDTQKQTKLIYTLDDYIKEQSRALYKEYGKFNYNSSKQLADLFDILKIGYNKTDKGNPSIKNEDLDAIEHPIGNVLRQVRKAEKVLNTFVNGAFINYNTNNRIHCNFYALRGDGFGTVTGRTSAQDPNLQQVPHPIDPKDAAEIGFDFGKACRDLFISEENHDFGKDDFSQIEYRFIGHYAIGDRSSEIRDRYINDPETDYHQLVMDWTGVDRTTAKRLNFGMAYYMGVGAMSKKFGWTLDKAQQLINKYFDEVPFIKDTREKVVDVATKREYIKTIYGRRARLNPDMLVWKEKAEEIKEKAKLERRTMTKEEYKYVRMNPCYPLFNYLIQGSAADLTKKAMVDCYKKGLFDILKLHLVVHDELCVSVPQSVEGIQAYREMKETMQNAIKLKVPVMSEAQIGPSWGEGDKIYEKEGTDKKSGKHLLTWAELEKRYL